jgi:hypothetical protein
VAFFHGKFTRVFVDQYNLSSYFNEATTTREAGLAETTTFGATAKTFLQGFVDGVASLAGFWDGAASAVDVVLAAALGSATTKVVTISRNAADAVGDMCEIFVAHETAYEITSSIDDASQISAEMQSSGGLDTGVILHANEAETVDANEASVDNAAATSNGGVATLHITAFSGLTNVIVTIEHSTDDSTWVTLVTFATATDVTSERVLVAAATTVRRYMRAVTNVTGTGSVTYVAAFARR